MLQLNRTLRTCFCATVTRQAAADWPCGDKAIEILHNCRYEDNGDAVNNLVVIAKQTGNKSIEDFGSPDKFLSDNANLMGEDVWRGALS